MANSNDEYVLDIGAVLTPLSIFLGSIIIASAIFFGLRGTGVSLTAENDNRDTDIVAKNDTGNVVAPTAPVDQYPAAKTTIDNSPVLGDKSKAKVAIVEFSDYECPFCKRFHSDTFPQIVQEYVDTGKAIFVYRDLPLSFHNPNATEQAMAGKCIQEISGDTKFFEYAQTLYERTTSNKGFPKASLYPLAEELGVDKERFTDCLDTERFANAVLKDSADAAKAGVSGTPGFVIGVLDKNGNVDGIRISGAQPFSVFAEKIDQQLAK